jgi:hypothetical protein
MISGIFFTAVVAAVDVYAKFTNKRAAELKPYEGKSDQDQIKLGDKTEPDHDGVGTGNEPILDQDLSQIFGISSKIVQKVVAHGVIFQLNSSTSNESFKILDLDSYMLDVVDESSLNVL